MVTYPYLARVLGPERLGAVHFMDYAVGLVYSVASLGIPAYGLYRIAQLQALGLSKKYIVLQMMILPMTLSLVGFGIFYWLMIDRPNWYYIHTVLPIGFVHILANSVIAEWYLQGRERFDIPTIRNLIFRILGLLIIFWIVRAPADYDKYYWIVAVSVLLSAIINLIWIRNDLRKEKESTVRTTLEWKELYLFFIGTVFISSTDYLDATILGLLRSEAEVGYYSNAAKLIRLSLVVPMALNLVVSPQLSSHFALNDATRAKQILNQTIGWLIFLSLPICLLYFLYANQLTILFAGAQFEPSIPLMRWMAGIPLFISLSNLLIYFGLFGKDRKLKQKIVAGVVGGILISIVLNVCMIPIYGARGAAINSFIVEFGFMALFIGWIKPELNWSSHLKSLMTCLLFIPLYQLTEAQHWDAFSTLFLGGCGSVLLYLLMQHFIWKHSFISDMQKMIRPSKQ